MAKATLRAASLELERGESMLRVPVVGDERAGNRLMIKARLGTIITKNDLIRMNKVNGELGRCAARGRVTEETPEHILIDCQAHSRARGIFLGRIAARLWKSAPRSGEK